MAGIEFRGRVRRVGNSLALLVPAEKAARLRLRPGQDVNAKLDVVEESLLGLFEGLYDGPYVRSAEDRDRENR